MTCHIQLLPRRATLFAACRDGFLAALAGAERVEAPFRHWRLQDALPDSVRTALTLLPMAPPVIGDTQGRRETHNTSRIFLDPAARRRWPVAAALAACFQEPTVTNALAGTTGAALDGSSLRIEYCLDRNGFWLEPHTDIGAKRFTLLIYLSQQPGAEDWGTDLYHQDGSHAGRAPAPAGAGLIFVPGADTWHGFERRPIFGIRRSLIVNYVVPEWRARHELAFPDRPVASALPLPV